MSEKNSKCELDPIEHNKAIFHLGQCPDCYSRHSIEEDRLFGAITKREEFAKAAMHGLLSSLDPNCQGWEPNESNVHYAASLSVTAADALLKALEQDQPQKAS